ncbi:DUF4097 family beta strand repeat-containing protein [Actinacidiphila sp. bgisy160]|uniref:DUF4097 family beta strand repeat-containing protein n=1 Tax=Actinacidiphila sp. bgisy160 TaxID=3413796 RepID=UPI003D75A897
MTTGKEKAVVKSWRVGAAVLALVAGGFLASCDSGGGERARPAGPAPGSASVPGAGTGASADAGGGAPSSPSPHAYEVSGARALSVRNVNGTVRVTAGSGPVSVVETLEYGAVKPTTRHRVEDGTLELVGSGCGDSSPCRVDYTVTVPAAMPVTVRLDNGDVDVEGVTGPVDLTTRNGGVRGASLGAREATLKSANGTVEAAFTAAPKEVDAGTGNGAVTVTVPAGRSYDVHATADVGMREVSVPADPSSPHRITATTRTGVVTVRTG